MNTNAEDKLKDKTKTREHYIGVANCILLNVIPLLLVVVAAIFFAIFTTVETSYSKQLERGMSSNCESVSRKIEVWSNHCISTLSIIANQYETGYLGDKNNYTAYMEEWAATLMTGSEGIYVVYNDEVGTVLSHDGKEFYPEYLTSDWFNFGLTCDSPQFDECSYYENDPDYSVTIAKNLKDRDGNIVGIAASDLYFDDIRNTIEEESKKLDSSFLLIDTKSGMVIAASNKDYCGHSIDDSKDQFLTDLLTGFDKTVTNKKIKTSKGDYAATIHNIYGTEWYLMIYENYADAYATLRALLALLVFAAAVIFGGIAAIVSFTVSRMMKHLKKASDDIDEISSGNLKVNFDSNRIGIENEITDINNNLHTYISKLSNIISDVNVTSDILKNDSVEFENLAGGMNEATIAEKMSLELLSDDVQAINESIKNLSEDSMNLSRIAEETAVYSKEAKTRMETVQVDSEETAENLNKVAERMHVAQKSIEELVSHVSNVENSAEQISSITSVIKGIAAQTNLLSLNASIEAARAGEVGRGFAVVAEEIKQLAETSNENAGMIEELINNISDLMSKTGDATRKSAEDITNGVEILETIVDSYGNTVEQIKETSAQINNMLENANEVDAISARMSDAVSVQTSGTSTIITSTEELGKMVDDSEAQSSQLKDSAEELKEMSEQLHKQMQFFKL